MGTDDGEHVYWEAAEAALGARPTAVHFTPIEHHVVAGATRRIGWLDCTEGSGAIRRFVVKHLQHVPEQKGRWRTSDVPGDSFFWRREADFYAQSVCWPELPRLRSARAYYVQMAAAEAVVLLEALPERTAADWPPDALLSLAETLAEAQAMGLAPHLPVTDMPFLDAYVARRSLLMSDAQEIMEPTGLDAVDALGSSRDDLACLHAATEPLLVEFRALPQVFSHNDCWQPNMLGTPGGRVALIDFAHCGWSAVGQDAANLVIDGIADGLIPPDTGRSLFERFLSRYAERFAAAAGGISADEIAAASRRAMALKYAWLIPATFKAALSEESRAHLAERHGSAERFLTERARGLRVVADLVAEAAAAYR